MDAQGVTTMAQATMWRTTYRVPDTLLSDTEESVLGTQWHQSAIAALADMIEEVARRRGATWGVCNQIALVGLQHEDGTAYDPHPDVMVLGRPLPSGDIASISVADASAPLFVMEVASKSTGRNDTGDKRRAYEAIGVPEYIVFDPDGGVLRTPLRAWRLHSGVYAPWAPDPDGWWHSASLAISFQATQPFMTVRDRNGQLIGLSSQVRQHAERLEQRLSEAEQARVEAEQARVEAERQRAELEEQVRRLRAQHGE